MAVQLSNDEIKEVVCLQCNAEPLQPCMEKGMPLLGFHKARIELRQKLPVYDCPLDPTDKAIIVGYAFVMLCNSVAANSKKLFSKKYTSQEIQRMFAKSGMQAAIQDGFIGPEKTPKGAEQPQLTQPTESLCGKCHRPENHIQHTPGSLAFHPFEQQPNRHDRRAKARLVQ